MTIMSRMYRARMLLAAAMFAAFVGLEPTAVKAQWTVPDTSQNINNTNTGNVGVGKTTPGYKLDVLSSINIIARFDSTASAHSQVLINAASGFNANLTLQRAGVAQWNIGNIASNDRFALANASGTELFSLTQSGKVGIGTNTPQDALHIFDSSGVGTLRVQGGNNVAGFVSVWDAGPMLILSNNRNPLTGNNFKTTVPGAQIQVGAVSAPEDIAFLTISSGTVGNGTELVRIKANGRLGIGTASPGYKLDVQSGSINSSGGLCIAGDCKTAWSQVGGSSQWTTGIGGAINYGGGNVGVGVATPSYKLDVQGGSINSSIGLCIAGDCKTAWSQVGGTSQWTNGSGGAINYAGGNVGVGVATPGYKFDVQGGSINSSGGLCIAGDCKTAWSQVGGSSQWTNGSSGAINYGGGNVGVGVATPTTKLDVGGTVNASAFTVGGTTVVSSQWATGGTTINYAAGNVGIGTASPTEKLHVTGNIKVSGNIDIGGNINSKYQDLAEWVESSQELSAGTVVVLDRAKSNHVVASTQAYDSRVAGVISWRPGIALGEAGAGRVLVATTGRVKVKVDASDSPINIGDLLVTSDKEGVAMKSVPVEIGVVRIHRPGTLIGKALEPLAQGTGEILVLLSLQ
jgi:hypothetical protein